MLLKDKKSSFGVLSTLNFQAQNTISKRMTIVRISTSLSKNVRTIIQNPLTISTVEM